MYSDPFDWVRSIFVRKLPALPHAWLLCQLKSHGNQIQQSAKQSFHIQHWFFSHLLMEVLLNFSTLQIGMPLRRFHSLLSDPFFHTLLSQIASSPMSPGAPPHQSSAMQSLAESVSLALLDHSLALELPSLLSVTSFWVSLTAPSQFAVVLPCHTPPSYCPHWTPFGLPPETPSRSTLLDPGKLGSYPGTWPTQLHTLGLGPTRPLDNRHVKLIPGRL